MYTIIDMMYLVDQSKPCAQKYLQKIARCLNLQLPILFFVKSITSDMHHHNTYIRGWLIITTITDARSFLHGMEAITKH